MNNDLVNEIAVARGNQLMNLRDHQITAQVKQALVALMGECILEGLQGLDSENDGITKPLWQQAVQAAEMSGALTFPQFMDDAGIPEDAEPCSYGEAVRVIAGRVARAILIINGNWDSIGNWDDKEDWYLL